MAEENEFIVVLEEEPEPLKRAKEKYQRAMEVAYKESKYAKEIARLLGIPKDKVDEWSEKAAPVVNWKRKFATEDDRKDRSNYWIKKFAAAFGVGFKEK